MSKLISWNYVVETSTFTTVLTKPSPSNPLGDLQYIQTDLTTLQADDSISKQFNALNDYAQAQVDSVKFDVPEDAKQDLIDQLTQQKVEIEATIAELQNKGE